MASKGLETHLWVGNHSRDLEIEGKPIVLFRCPICERNFAREPAETNWRAARVGSFRVEYLSESISERWVSEPCPGRQASDIHLSFAKADSPTREVDTSITMKVDTHSAAKMDKPATPSIPTKGGRRRRKA
jgi:hypothetical protein